MVSFYFDTKRNIANGKIINEGKERRIFHRNFLCVFVGLVTAGTGIGALSFGPLANVIMAAFGWKIGMLVFAAIMLTGVLFGAIMKPLVPQKVPIKTKDEIESVLTFLIMTHLTICFGFQITNKNHEND